MKWETERPVPGKRFGLTLILAFSDRCGDGPKALVPLGEIEGSLHPPLAAGALNS